MFSCSEQQVYSKGSLCLSELAELWIISPLGSDIRVVPGLVQWWYTILHCTVSSTALESNLWHVDTKLAQFRTDRMHWGFLGDICHMRKCYPFNQAATITAKRDRILQIPSPVHFPWCLKMAKSNVTWGIWEVSLKRALKYNHFETKVLCLMLLSLHIFNYVII